MSDIPGVAMEIQHGRSLPDGCRGLFYEIADNSTAVFSSETHVLVGEAQRAWRLYKHTRTLGLLWIVQQRVLVVIEPSNHSDNEQDENYDPSIHPVNEDED